MLKSVLVEIPVRKEMGKTEKLSAQKEEKSGIHRKSEAADKGADKKRIIIIITTTI